MLVHPIEYQLNPTSPFITNTQIGIKYPPTFHSTEKPTKPKWEKKKEEEIPKWCPFWMIPYSTTMMIINLILLTAKSHRLIFNPTRATSLETGEGLGWGVSSQGGFG